jgi:hypothetical protein
MPIRINLLAEAQSLEDMRRRDPVKRAIWVGVFLVVLVLAWSSSLQLKAMISKGDLNRVEGQLNTHTNEYQQVLANQKKLADMESKLIALQRLATNRVLHASMLDALQHTVIPDIELIRLRTEVAHSLNEASKPKTNANKTITPGKPATVTERVVMTLEAKDTGANPGDQVNRYKQTIADFPYFQQILEKTNGVRLANLSPPQTTGPGKAFVLFTLECRQTEKTR